MSFTPVTTTIRKCVQTETPFPIAVGDGGKSRVVATSETLTTTEFVQGTNCVLSSSRRALDIAFKCTRSVNACDKAVAKIFGTVIAKNAASLLVSNPNQCVHNAVTGACGNMRGHLSECRCEALCRLKFGARRTQFEDQVIDALVAIAKAQKGPFNINLAVFASGGLHGEEVLLMRLIDRLQREKLTGNIHVSLIDSVYQPNIAAGHEVFYPRKPKFIWDQLLGFRGDLKQCLTELSLCLPSTITLSGRVYGHSDDYIFRAKLQPHLKHDLLIGADIEDTMGVVGEINGAAGKTDRPAIVLIKQSEADSKEVAALVCSVKPEAQGAYTATCVKV